MLKDKNVIFSLCKSINQYIRRLILIRFIECKNNLKDLRFEYMLTEDRSLDN